MMAKRNDHFLTAAYVEQWSRFKVVFIINGRDILVDSYVIMNHVVIYNRNCLEITYIVIDFYHNSASIL